MVDFTGWQADAWDPFTPWGGRDAPVRATAVETALERELSRVMLGSAPHWTRLRKGATLVAQGDPGHELYLLIDGLLAVEIDGVTVAELGPGAVVGEVALLEGGRRTATLRAVTACRVAAVPGDRIDRAALAELARTRGWPGPAPAGTRRDRLPGLRGAEPGPGQLLPELRVPLPAPGRPAARPARRSRWSSPTWPGRRRSAERLDPESLAVVMARWFDHMRAVVERHGGRVQKFVGDAVVAVFGIPVVNEDDALRAVRAAAEHRAGLGQLNGELGRDWGVTACSCAPGSTPARWSPATRASATPWSWATPSTWPPGWSRSPPPARSCSAVDLRPGQGRRRGRAGPPLHLKGKGAPVGRLPAGPVDPGAPGHARRQDAPIVGREPELRLFAWVYERVVGTASSHLVTVLGPAGVGKTRLVAEAWPASPGRPCCAAAACRTARASPTGQWPRWSARPPGSLRPTRRPRPAAKLRRLLDAGAGPSAWPPGSPS